jgi:hypothetical protein
MVPSEFKDFFVASTSAGAALVGLLFVAIAVAPERFVMGGAPSERRAVASSAFTALINAFFISFGALLPYSNIATLSLVMSSIGLVNSLFLGFTELRRPPNWRAGIRRAILILTSLILYGFELYYTILLLRSPGDTGSVLVLADLVMGVYGLGIVRAWELLGASRFGLLRWFNPLYDINENRLTEADKEKPAP